jgi:xanthine dehydrogenase molybdopterin-binding subunit B
MTYYSSVRIATGGTDFGQGLHTKALQIATLLFLFFFLSLSFFFLSFFLSFFFLYLKHLTKIQMTYYSSVRIATGGTDFGQGLHTKALQIASYALDIPTFSFSFFYFSFILFLYLFETSD